MACLASARASSSSSRFPEKQSSSQARRGRSSVCRAVAVSNNGHAIEPPSQAGRTEFVAETLLPTAKGKFRLRGYRHTANDGSSSSEPTAMIHGQPEGGVDVPVRVHDACFTSGAETIDVLRLWRCYDLLNCPPVPFMSSMVRGSKYDFANIGHEQLQLALEYVRQNSPGIVIYLQQEGRGIGLANKIAAYSLQEKGYDTVDANRQLGLPDDAREYTSVVNILADLNIQSIRLITNNPRKISHLEGLGVSVTGRIPCLVKPGKYSSDYLEAKGRRMDHLDLDGSWYETQPPSDPHDAPPPPVVTTEPYEPPPPPVVTIEPEDAPPPPVVTTQVPSPPHLPKSLQGTKLKIRPCAGASGITAATRLSLRTRFNSPCSVRGGEHEA